ncbi:gamma-glutamylcyclotransferase family protein [Orrella sp. JC864]|uniref:gamma-glutamylcyclotransferase family protein n=1 Tax=Orrella sp. JC864 TaxID=3120298 RepID=UPI0012BC9FA6
MRPVFVYGSLRAGEVNDLSQAARRHGCAPPRWHGVGWVAGTLYDLGDYPALLATGPHRVRGDVYLVDDALLAVMDEIEEYVPGTDCMYQRQPVEVEMDGRTLRCEYYPVAARYLQGLAPLDAQDWVAYRRARDARR